MTIEIKLPDIGSMEVEVTDILVKIGDVIEKEQALITVEGNKISMEIPSPFSGIVKEILVSIGDIINTGFYIMLFENNNLISESQIAEIQREPLTSINTNTKNVNMPDIGINELEVIDILVNVGDKIILDQPLIIVEGNKVSMEIPAPFAGIVKKITVTTGSKVKINALIMIFEIQNLSSFTLSENKIKSSIKDIKDQINTKEISFKEHNSIHATPGIRRLARELGINLINIQGKGRKGRILKEDIYFYVKQAILHVENCHNLSFNKTLSNKVNCSEINFSKFGPIEEIELSSIQKISGNNLSKSWINIPHVTHFDKTDITELEDFRRQQNLEANKHKLNFKITPIIFIMKAVAFALKKMPRFNSSLSVNSNKLILKKYINIGVAINTSNGILVPVFKNVNKKSIIELSEEMTIISKKARAGKLHINDIQGGCFTISSLGNSGTSYFAPIINAPEVAILGISKFNIEPLWNGKEFIPRLMMPISLSFDHRVIDGIDGAHFITKISSLLSDIRCLLM